MSSLPPNQALTTKWPVVGERSPRADDRPWTVSISGQVEKPQIWTLEELRAMPQTHQLVDVHCVTRWSHLAMPFGGIRLATLLETAVLKSEAKYLSFAARSERNHSTSLPTGDALALGALLALEAGSEPLESIHGGPIRVVVPGRYFYKSVKWLERIEVLAEDRLGYWEAEAGYHNDADPWLEQRYIASKLSPQKARALLEARDFGGLDLLSLQASDRDLTGLKAVGALLRNADFRRSHLANANFTRANLSNAHCESADLRGAVLLDADLEGASFLGADLRGADLRGASLFGTTFTPEAGEEGQPAILDGTTRTETNGVEALSPTQVAFLKRVAR